MSRVALGVKFVAVSGLLARAPSAANCQEVPKDTKAAIKERDRLRDEYQKLRAAGKTTEAIAARGGAGDRERSAPRRSR